MKRFLSYLMAGVAVLLAPSLALADIANNLSSYDLFTPTMSDKSMNYLGQVFGTVGGVVHGTSGQLLSEVFRIFNYAMVVVASLILIYSVIRSIIDTAMEGEFMGRNKNSAWIIVRAVMGIGILVPKYTGYSMIQVFVMWVAVQGIGLADNVWGRAIDYLGKEGGTVYVAPAGTLGGQGGMKDTLQVANQILSSEVCMYSLQNLARKDRDDAIAQLKNDPTNPALKQRAMQPYVSYRPLWNDNAQTVSFGIANASSSSVCGAFSWRKTGDEQDSFTQYKKAGLQQIVANLEPVAKSIAGVSTTPLNDQQNRSIKKRAISDLLGATADYENIMIPALNSAKTNAKHELTSTLAEAREKGWIVAGSYYWDLAKINNKLNDSVKNYQPTSASSYDASKLNSDQKAAVSSGQSILTKYIDIKQLTDMLQLLQDKLDPAINPAYKASILADLAGQDNTNPQEIDKRLQGVQRAVGSDPAPISFRDKHGVGWGVAAMGASSVSVAAGSVAAGASMMKMTMAMGALVGVWFEVMNAPGDPLSMLQILGQAMVGIAVITWMTTILAAGAAAVLTAGSWMSPLAYMNESGMKIFAPVFIGFILTLFINGMVLTTYVPLIPFFIFTFAAIGWLISIFEAIIAGPLVAAAITHPEGHDLLGKAEQAVMLLLGVFLRPVVMVIGFLAAMIICRVALRIVFAGFSHIVAASGITMSGVNMFGTIGLMIVLTTVCSTIITMVFTAGVVKSWETMWMWIGFHQPSNSVESALQEVKGGLHGGAQGLGDAVGNVAKGNVDTWAGGNAKKRKEKDAEKSTKLEQTT